VLFESALQDYKRETGYDLVNHRFTQLFGDCHSIESVVVILQEQVRPGGGFRGSDGDRIEKALEGAVSVLYMLSTSTALRLEDTHRV